MFLIVGATGLVGGEIARQLRNRGCAVKALIRGRTDRPAAKALAAAGVGLVTGDLADPATLEAACAGIATVVCTATSMPAASGESLQRVDHDGVLALIDAAERSAVGRFVYVSFSGNLRVESPLARAKRACEARLAASRMSTVALRPSYFMQVWLSPRLGFDAAQGRARIYGDGTAGVSYVSATDVASLGVAAATEAGVGHEVWDIGGPETLSQLDAVAIFERLTGRRFSLEHVPLAALEAQLLAPDALQQTFAALMLSCARGDAHAGARDLARRHGVVLTSVEDFARAELSGSG